MGAGQAHNCPKESQVDKKRLKAFKQAISPYGLTVEQHKEHFAVVKDGRRVGTISCNGDANNMRQAMRDLRRGGHVDDKACRISF